MKYGSFFTVLYNSSVENQIYKCYNNYIKIIWGDVMVKHIILWKLKEEHNNDMVKQGIKDGLESLKGVIPGLIEIVVERKPLPSSNADVMLYSVFDSQNSLKNYSVHPAHVNVANTFVRPYTAERVCMDFEEKA